MRLEFLHLAGVVGSHLHQLDSLLNRLNLHGFTIGFEGCHDLFIASLVVNFTSRLCILRFGFSLSFILSQLLRGFVFVSFSNRLFGSFGNRFFYSSGTRNLNFTGLLGNLGRIFGSFSSSRISLCFGFGSSISVCLSLNSCSLFGCYFFWSLFRC